MKAYYQTTGYTCGPSSAMMVLEHFNQIESFSVETEMSIAKICRFSESNHSSSLPNLAGYLLFKGLKVNFMHEDYERILSRFRKGSADFWRYEKMIERYSEQEQLAKSKGLTTTLKNPSLDDIACDLKNNKKILAIVQMGDIPHCVVINNVSEDSQFEIFCPIRGRYLCFGNKILEDMRSQTGRAYLSIWK